VITFDGIIFSTPNRRGGVNVYFRQLMRHAALGTEPVTMLVHETSITAPELGCRSEQLLYRPPRRFERFRLPRDLPPGVLHTSYYRGSTQPDIRNVVTVYDFTYERFSKGPRRWVHSAQKRAAIERAAAVICISHNTRRDLLEFMPRCAPERTFVTHLAADEAFTPLTGASTSITDRPFALFVGGRGGYKNFAVAIEAIRRTRDCAIVCVGGGPFEPEELRVLTRTLPGRHFHAGSLDTVELNRLYNVAVCLLYPSLYEGFGIPPLEAMRAGCPFVALNRSSVPEVAGSAGILLDDPDVEAMTAAIEACMEPLRRAELRRIGFEQAARFSWRSTYEQTLPIYQGLLA
jgi:mannosyltransferase